jgi:hypothetical protein
VSNIDRLKILPRCIVPPVPSYRFSFRDHYGNCREEIGRLELPDDDEALAFGEAIIRDLKRGDAVPYAGWMMYITESARLLGMLPFPASVSVRSPTYIFH